MGEVIDARFRFPKLPETAEPVADTPVRYKEYCQEILDLLKTKYIGSVNCDYFIDGSESTAEEKTAEKQCYFQSAIDGQVWRAIEYKMSDTDKNFQYRIETVENTETACVYIINPNKVPTSVWYSYRDDNDITTEKTEEYDANNDLGVTMLYLIKLMLKSATTLSTTEADELIKLHQLRISAQKDSNVVVLNKE